MALRLDLVEEHAEEAAFLFHRREWAASMRQHDLRTLLDLDERLLAHLDGVCVAGDDGFDAVAQGLASKEPGEAFVAAWVALDAPSARRTEPLREALMAPGSRRGLSAALRLSPQGAALLRGWSADPAPAVRAVALDALGFRGDHAAASHATGLLAGIDRVERLAGIGLVARFREAALGPRLDACLEDAEETVALAALRAGAELGRPAAHRAARAWIARDDARGVAACDVLAAVGDARDAKALAAACASDVRGRAAIIALGRLGARAAIDPLMQALDSPALARRAAHGLERLLGIDLARDGCAAPPPEDTPAEGIDPDEDLPWPAPHALARLARERARDLDADHGLWRGGTWSADRVCAEAEAAPLPERERDVFECMARVPGAPHFERGAWATAQARAWPAWVADVVSMSRAAR